MKEKQTTPAVFEILQCCFTSSDGGSSVDYNLITDDRGTISNLTLQDLVHLRDFLNHYLCSQTPDGEQ